MRVSHHLQNHFKAENKVSHSTRPSNRRKIIVMKFGGTTAGSSKDDCRIKDARLLIEEKLNTGYFVIPVFSAIRRPDGPDGSGWGITDTLLRYRSIIAAEKLDGFLDRLWRPHLELARDLKVISQETCEVFAPPGKRDLHSIQNGRAGKKEDWSFIQGLWTEIRRLVSRASTYYDEPPSASGLDALAVGGERLIVRVIVEYLNAKWKDAKYPYRAKVRTAKDIGILTDGNFGDANILPGTRYELIVVKKILEDAKQHIVPIVTGFDGLYKDTGETIAHTINMPRDASPTDTGEALRVALDRAFRQPELRDRAVREIRLTCFFSRSDTRHARDIWEQNGVSTHVTLASPAQSADEVYKAVQPKLLVLAEQAAGLGIRQLLMQLSGVQHDQGFVTTLGRGGSDLTATYIAKAVRAESIYLLKDTRGVQTANPKIVPEAKTIQHLPYALAVAAGNIQHKALQPAQEGGLPIEVFNPKYPDIRTVIGPSHIQDDLYLMPNPVAARLLSMQLPPSQTPVRVMQEVLKALSALGTLDVLEMRYDAASIVLLLKETGDIEYLERHIQQHLGDQPRSELCHYLRVVGAATPQAIERFVAALLPFRPLFYPVGRSSTYTLAAALPAEVDIHEACRVVHGALLANYVSHGETERSTTWNHKLTHIK
jgi:aspartokinase